MSHLLDFGWESLPRGQTWSQYERSLKEDKRKTRELAFQHSCHDKVMYITLTFRFIGDFFVFNDFTKMQLLIVGATNPNVLDYYFYLGPFKKIVTTDPIPMCGSSYLDKPGSAMEIVGISLIDVNGQRQLGIGGETPYPIFYWKDVEFEVTPLGGGGEVTDYRIIRPHSAN